ncbi:hypothetical protein BJF79_12595 [Actinomadura sp. CNU-125]|uniref:ABC transporter permease n=1 Tax=Actinomadura sp. CNU-125 TaxID=1904961 RepID=UPI000960DB87|nr:ABC transporter permease [Actinomadura sp. CNU-125]OLT25953.1 hypothetical protein BJF79_12595 [Actinomadura sp. CNU-125]
MGRSIADGEGWAAGDTVRGRYQDGTSATFRIAGVFDDRPSVTPSAPSMIVDWAAYRTHDPGAPIDRIEIVAGPRPGPGSELDAALREALRPWPNLEVKDRAEIKSDAAGEIEALLRLITGLLVLSVLIAALGIVNTLALAVAERTRELGLLRAVGMDRRLLRRMIRYEAVVISLFGGSLGIGTGTGLGLLLQRALSSGGDGMAAVAVPWGLLAACAAGAAAIGVLAAA